MQRGVLIALFAYGIFAVGDAIIKGIGQSLATFEIVFWTTLFASIPILLSKPKSEPLNQLFVAQRPWLLMVRSLALFTAILTVVYAFTHIPLAEAYALIFLSPVFSTIIAIVFLKEEMTRTRWISLAFGFAGVVFIMRPGFKELELGHMAAIVSAVANSISVTLLKQATKTEKRTTIVAISNAYAIGLSLLAILIFEGAKLPTWENILTLALIGLLGGIGQISLVAASQIAPAARVAQAQYSQMVWAIAFGIIFFNEYLDVPTIFGIIVIMISGVMNLDIAQARTLFSINWALRWRKK